jgi:hypothetical protein
MEGQHPSAEVEAAMVRLRSWLDVHPGSSLSACAGQLGLDYRLVLVYAAVLFDQGLIRRTGIGKGSRWYAV